MGAWIEIIDPIPCQPYVQVAPRVGAWIEIRALLIFLQSIQVAPRVGAWIEIKDTKINPDVYMSLPAWERGLK